MKKSKLRPIYALVMASACIFATPTTLNAADSSVMECSKELLLAYFPETFVTETLKKFKVPESEWAGINKDLSSKDGDVIKMVEEKASKMDPNPLKDPQQRQGAVKIFRETLLEIFSSIVAS